MGKTFVEKILDAPKGSIVFRKPDLVLSHDNSASIRKTFERMNGTRLADPDQLLIVLDHNAPPTNAKLATDYQAVREFVRVQGVKKFYDAGKVTSAICVAPVILARAGILSGKTAAVFSSSKDELSRAGAKYTAKDTAVAGKIITASGPAAAKKFAQEIIKSLE